MATLHIRPGDAKLPETGRTFEADTSGFMNYDPAQEKPVRIRYAFLGQSRAKESCQRPEAALQSRWIPIIPRRPESDGSRKTLESIDNEDEQASADPDHRSAKSKLPGGPREQTLSSPATILRKGNSDPFAAFAISIDPAVNDLMVLYRDFVIPAEYSLGSKSWVSSPAATRDWQDCINGLKDKCAANGFLAMAATIKSSISPSKLSDRQALVYRTRSTALLRERLGNESFLRSAQTHWQIHMLLAASVFARDLTASRVHASMLRRLLEQESKQGKVDVGMLTQMVYNDIQVSAMYLTRPSFDVNEWLPDVFQPAWNAAMGYLPSLDAATTSPIDLSVDSDILRTIFVMRREAMVVWTSSSSEVISTPLVMLWLTSRNLIAQGRLLNHYNDMAEKYITADETEFDHICAQAYISLAALFWTRSISTSPVVCGKALYDTRGGILEALKTTLTDSQILLFGHVPSLTYENARLWALFVGANAEQAEVSANKNMDATKGWFNTSLATQARSMGLLSWQQLRTVLQGFLYTDHLPPNGSNWFWKTMSADLESAGGEVSSSGQ